MAWLVKLLSQAALSALLRFVTQDALEDVMTTLIAQAMRRAVKLTDSTEDDAMVERWIQRAKEKNNAIS